MTAHKLLLSDLVLLLAFISHSAIGADADWRLIPKMTSGVVWVDVANAKFDANTVTASVKMSLVEGRAFYVVTADCAAATIISHGGERHEKDGSINFQYPPDEKPRIAPTGTDLGAMRGFLCDLRPAWRKWFQ